MARIRSVKPEICESETMAKLSAEEERTFVRLWTHCDDFGRERDNQKLIKAAIYPLHDDVSPDTISHQMEKFEALGLVVRYRVAGVAYFAIPSWSEHQHPQRPKPSKYPPPPDEVLIAYASRTPPSDDTDVYASVVVVGEVEVDGEVEVVVVPPPPAKRARATDVEFDQFWQTYPRREAKRAARAKLDAVIRSGVPIEAIVTAAAAYRDLPGRDPQFTKLPTTWLNQGCWDDELVPRRGRTVVERNREGFVEVLNNPPLPYRERMAALSEASAQQAIGGGA